MKLYISDCHFFHGRMNYAMDCRGFSSTEELNEHMIEQWNKAATKKDEVYVLGDLSFGSGTATNEIIKRLNFKRLYLIEGNHDRRFLKDRAFDSSAVEWVKPYAKTQDNKHSLILSHYPIMCYDGQYRKNVDGESLTTMMYGHVHLTQDYSLIKRYIEMVENERELGSSLSQEKGIPIEMINCFCMRSDYRPLSLEEWREIEKAEKASS